MVALPAMPGSCARPRTAQPAGLPIVHVLIPADFRDAKLAVGPRAP